MMEETRRSHPISRYILYNVIYGSLVSLDRAVPYIISYHIISSSLQRSKFGISPYIVYHPIWNSEKEEI